MVCGVCVGKRRNATGGRREFIPERGKGEDAKVDLESTAREWRPPPVIHSQKERVSKRARDSRRERAQPVLQGAGAAGMEGKGERLAQPRWCRKCTRLIAIDLVFGALSRPRWSR